MKTINILGAGNVGSSLAYALNGKLTIQCVLNRTLKKANCLIEGLNTGIVVKNYEALQPADYHALTVSDDQLHLVANKLAEQSIIRPNDIVFHCSGALTANEVLVLLEQQGALIASCHPAYSISKPLPDLTKIPFVLEGNHQACDSLKQLFASVGACCLFINSEDKLIYHTGLVIASNYTVTLLASSIQLLRKQTHLKNKEITFILKTLVQNTIESVFNKSEPLEALTGPAMRGDIALVQREEKALASSDPILSKLYRILADFTVDCCS